MKKKIFSALTLTMGLSLTACSGGASSAPTTAAAAVPLARRLLLLGAGPGSAAPGPQPSPDRTGMSTTDCLSSYSRPFAPPISFPGPPPVPIFRNNRSFHGIY